MRIGLGAAACLGMALAGVARAQDGAMAHDAALFGAREDVEQVSLSPDGTQVAYLAPGPGTGTVLMVRGVADDAKPRGIAVSDGKPERLNACRWVSNARLACSAYGTVDIQGRKVPFSRLFAIDADGKNIRQLSTRQNDYSRGIQLGGGEVVDWLPDETGALLMARNYLPDSHTGSLLGSNSEGTAVDRIDTVTLAVRTVEQPRREAETYLSDGRGTVRVMGLYDDRHSGQISGVEHFFYRRPGSRDWQRLGDYDGIARAGLYPLAVDHDLNVAYAFKRTNGRDALYSVALDGSGKETLLVDRADVDIDRLVRIGRRNRVIGVSYQTDARATVYFDPEIRQLAASLAKALPKQPNIRVVDSSLDERKLLVFADSDDDPGVYYLLDRDRHDLHVLMSARSSLVEHPLGHMAAMRYPAGDGTMIPAYLTLPPGKADARGLPAIVLPHGGPGSRDEWGFDWLPQYYASLGYAVLQPEFRGSAGYGDAWFQKNGFQSWRVAIGDVVDGGRWLIGQGADPKRLAIVGWSYGGYAALQSAVVAPTLFKAVVAIAPVTDLAMLKAESYGWSDNRLTAEVIGTGAHIREGSPLQNASRITVPVLLVHGTLDANVNYSESTAMAARLRSIGGKVDLLSFPGLDHYLGDSAARTKMLETSGAFLRTAMAP